MQTRNLLHSLPRIALAVALAVLPVVACAVAPAVVAEPTLTERVAALDDAVFDAFNRCADPAQLDVHASYFDADVEFYHDNGGVTWTREAMLANTARNVCGKLRRELVAGSLKVYPVPDHGAIAQGSHRFCDVSGKRCEGLADFAIVWRQDGAQWRITRVLSYAHRPNDAAAP